MGDGTVDGRSDIYGLGCVAYWLLTGELVFERATIVALAAAHVRERPVPVGERAPKPLSDALGQIVMSCLAKNPADRPQSARMLADALAALDLQPAWTEERANEWWDRFEMDRQARRRADIEARSMAPTVQLDP